MRQDAAGFLLAAVMDKPTGREGHKDHSNKEDHARSQLQADGSQPRSVSLLATFGASDEIGAAVRPVSNYASSGWHGYILVDPEANHNAKGDSQLLCRDESTADLGRRHFGVVDRDNHGQATDAHTTKRLCG